MKKLTAGIFATILGLTAVDAFAAVAGTTVASTKYVQGAIDSLAEVAKTGDYGDLINTPTIPSIEGLATTEYVDGKADAAQAAAIAAAATDATTKADAAQAAAIAAAATDATTKANTAETNAKAYTDQKTTDMATKTWVGDQGYITSGDLEGEGFATTEYVDGKADAAQAAAIAAAATDATTKADAAQAAAIAAAATDATTKANTAETNAKAYTDAEIDKIEGSMGNLGNTYVAWSYVDDDYNTPGIQ